MKNLMILTAVALMFIGQAGLAQNNTVSSVISVSVSSTDNTPILIWTTQKEINSSYFIVERSTDQLNYSAINTIKAAGYSLTSKNYEIEDFDSNSISYYYRVILVSMEGERICSSPIRAALEGENSMLSKK